MLNLFVSLRTLLSCWSCHCSSDYWTADPWLTARFMWPVTKIRSLTL